MPNDRSAQLDADLIAAVEARDIEGVGSALDAGASIDCTARVGDNRLDNASLWIATEQGDAAIVALLLQRGADPNANYEYGMCNYAYVAERAARQGRDDIVDLFLARGVRPDVILKLSIDAYRDHKALSERLYQTFDHWHDRKYDGSIAFAIVRTGVRRDLIAEALSHGVDPVAVFDALAREKYSALAAELLELSVRPSLLRSEPSTVLDRFHHSLYALDVSQWREGLRALSSIVRDVPGVTPSAFKRVLTEFMQSRLSHDSRHRVTGITEELVMLGADVGSLTLGERPFRFFHGPLTAFLLGHGLHIPSMLGYEALLGIGAMDRDLNLGIFARVLDRFRLSKPELDEALIATAERKLGIPIAWLLEQGADACGGESAALRMASVVGNTAAVRQLLAAGADPHADGDYALRMAHEKGHSEIIALLMVSAQ